MLKSGIPDMIPEKNILLVIDPLRIDFKKVYKSVMNTIHHLLTTVGKGVIRVCLTFGVTCSEYFKSSSK